MSKQNKTIYLISAAVAVLSSAVFASVVFAQVPPAATPAGGTFDQRLAQRKAERSITLEEKDQKRLANTCTKAQTQIRKVQTETRALSANRAQIYREINAKVWLITGMLKLANTDTFALEKQQAVYVQNVDQFQVILNEYQLVLDDLVVINCQADIVGFKALLDTSRLYYAQLIEQSTIIRNIVVNDIKPLLTRFTDALQPKSQGAE